MPDLHPRLVRNTRGRLCKRCNGEHEFITRLSDDAHCDVPVAFSLEKAIKISNLLANGKEDVIRVPGHLGEIVVLDDSARRLPKGQGVPLAQFVHVSQPA